jgi:hypothetical protein
MPFFDFQVPDSQVPDKQGVTAQTTIMGINFDHMVMAMKTPGNAATTLVIMSDGSPITLNEPFDTLVRQLG